MVAMDKRLDGFHDDLVELKGNMREIKEVLLGNEYNPNGMVQVQRDHGERIDNIEKSMPQNMPPKGISTIAKTGWGAGLAGAIYAIWEFIQQFSNTTPK